MSIFSCFSWSRCGEQRDGFLPSPRPLKKCLVGKNSVDPAAAEVTKSRVITLVPIFMVLLKSSQTSWLFCTITWISILFSSTAGFSSSLLMPPERVLSNSHHGYHDRRLYRPYSESILDHISYEAITTKVPRWQYPDIAIAGVFSAFDAKALVSYP